MRTKHPEMSDLWNRPGTEITEHHREHLKVKTESSTTYQWRSSRRQILKPLPIHNSNFAPISGALSYGITRSEPDQWVFIKWAMRRNAAFARLKVHEISHPSSHVTPPGALSRQSQVSTKSMQDHLTAPVGFPLAARQRT